MESTEALCLSAFAYSRMPAAIISKQQEWISRFRSDIGRLQRSRGISLQGLLEHNRTG